MQLNINNPLVLAGLNIPDDLEGEFEIENEVTVQWRVKNVETGDQTVWLSGDELPKVVAGMIADRYEDLSNEYREWKPASERNSQS